MLRYSLLSALLLVAAQPAHASSWADGMFDELTKDFGAVPHGTVAVHVFRLVNNTGAPVRIGNVRVSCGCTSARAVQSYLAPGQETVIWAQMDTRRFFGTKSVTIYVPFEQPRYDEARLSVQANSRDDIAFSPETINFGKVNHGATAAASMNLTFLTGGQIKITGVQSDSNYLLPAFKETRRENGEAVYQITAKIRPDAPPGKWFSDVWVKTNNPVLPRLRVPVAIEIEANLTVSPSALVWGEVKAGSESDRKVILRGAQPFRIVGIEGTDDQIRIQHADTEAKNVHVLNVTFNPSSPGPLHRTLRVHTDLENNPDVEFNAQAQVVP